MPVPHVPDGYHCVIPYLAPADAPAVIEFLEKTFEAEVVDQTIRPDGTIMHADLRIGDSNVMVGQVTDPSKARTCSVYVYVPDTEAAYRRALEAGGTSVMEPADQFYGDRNAGVTDPQGNLWWIGTHVEDVAEAEMERRVAKAAGIRD
jgi:uncharacterized glyoxalase superfamily protein PhnB